MQSQARSEVLDDIERSLTALSRGGRIRRLHKLLNLKAGIMLDRPLYVTLACLADCEPMRVTELAEALSIDVSTASRLVDQLITAGLINSCESPTDRRAVDLRISDKGKKTIRRLKSVRREALGELLADWTTEGKASFASNLGRFIDSLEAFLREKGI